MLARKLRATGETPGPGRPDVRDQLTAQELQIAAQLRDVLPTPAADS